MSSSAHHTSSTNSLAPGAAEAVPANQPLDYRDFLVLRGSDEASGGGDEGSGGGDEGSGGGD